MPQGIWFNLEFNKMKIICSPYLENKNHIYICDIVPLTLTHAALFGVLLHVASLQSLALEKA